MWRHSSLVPLLLLLIDPLAANVVQGEPAMGTVCLVQTGLALRPAALADSGDRARSSLLTRGGLPDGPAGRAALATAPDSNQTQMPEGNASEPQAPSGAASGAVTEPPVDAAAVSTSPVPTAIDVAHLEGVKSNSAGDLPAFLSGLTTNTFMVAGCLGVFMVLRLRYPVIYSNNVLVGVAPRRPQDRLFGWLSASLSTSTVEAAKSIGLDNAMWLEFCNLCMRILLALSVPLLLVMAPLHYLYGHGDAERVGDRLGLIAMANVANGHPWLYYLHAALVVFVCVVTQRSVYASQAKFLALRFQWLEALPRPRANTVLVEGIPPEYRSDARVREFFVKVFSEEQVQAAAVVKHTEVLEQLAAARDAAAHAGKIAELEWAKQGRDPSARPILRQLGVPVLTERLDAIDYYAQQVARLDGEVAAERARVLELAQTPGGVNADSAFVTFSGQREAEIAKNLSYTHDKNEWVVSVPPEPSSVLWSDLRQDERGAAVASFIGYAGVVGLYVGFLPISLGITNIAYAIQLGPLQPLWSSFAPTLGLTVFLSFLPTVMLAIFRKFFTLKSDRWAQQRLQVWYFWFQVVFVILVSAIGNDVVLFVRKVAESPFSIFSILADQLPGSTHFFMNYIVLQWTTHAMSMMRYVILAKFIAFKQLWPEEEARQMAEPEDQDYYGLGSRSSRLAIMMLIGIIYSTLSPLIALLSCLNFALCRLCYGYLIVFAETKKPDLGGAFWVTKLKHVLIGTVIYCILMAGVLAKRAPNPVPAAVAVLCLIYSVQGYNHFQSAFQWEKLPFCEVVRASSLSSTDSAETYVQPVLASGN